MINHSNPLASNLVNLWVPEDQYTDIASKGAYTYTGTLPGLGATDRGTAANLNPADVYYSTPSFNPSASVAWTMFSVFTWQSATFGTYPVICGMIGDGGACDRTLSVFQSTPNLFGYLYDGTARLLNGNTTLVAGRTYTSVLSVTGSGLMTLYLDGVADGTLSASNAGYASYTNPKWAIGTGGYAGIGALGAHFRGYLGPTGYVYGEAWNATKAKMFHENPYQLLKPRTARRYTRYINTVGGGPTFNPAWARQANQFIGVAFR